MYNILTLNNISETGLASLDRSKYNVSSECKSPDAIILRSFKMHDMELPESLISVARAGSGYNNIPVEKCTEKGIVVFNTPGANSNAVKELVLGSLFMASRKVVDAVNWAQGLKGQDDVPGLVEKGKAAFTGPEIMGKKMGVIGLGAIGRPLADACFALGMTVYGYDPFLTLEDIKWKQVSSEEEIFTQCDYISVHVPLNDETRNKFNADVFSKVKKGLYLINFSRAELVDESAVLQAVSDGTVSCYVTDFPTAAMLGVKNIIPVPHLGAGTPESEENCAVMASSQTKNFLEYGTILNSVNFPRCELIYTGRKRLCINHKEIPHFTLTVTELLEKSGCTISNMIHKVRREVGYTIIDINEAEVGCLAEIEKLDAVFRIRVI